MSLRRWLMRRSGPRGQLPPLQGGGAWVFVSHSHKDAEKVRRVRDALELEGHNPLLFFLKCLDDDSELDDLIRREIAARTWFILCDSPNARSSRWVRSEVSMIKSLPGKVYEVVDLDDDLERQVEEISSFSRRARVFVSYTHDKAVSDALRSALREQDFEVFVDCPDRKVGPNLWSEIADRIDWAVQRGFCLVVLSPSAAESIWVQRTLQHALESEAALGRTSSVLAVIGSDRKETFERLPGDIRRLLADSQVFDLTAGPLGERIAALIESLKTR